MVPVVVETYWGEGGGLFQVSKPALQMSVVQSS